MTNVEYSVWPNQNVRQLCRDYFVAFMNRVSIDADAGAGAVRQRSVRWAVGVLYDKQHEILSAWLASNAAPARLAFYEGLRLRGVEQIRFVVESDYGVDGTDFTPRRGFSLPSLCRLFRESLSQVDPSHRPSLSSSWAAVFTANTDRSPLTSLDDLVGSHLGQRYPQVLEQWRTALDQFGPFFALGSRQRGLIRRGDLMAQALQESVERSVARHGVFADEVAGLRFVQEALRRAERRLGGLMVRDRLASVGALARPACIAGPTLAMI